MTEKQQPEKEPAKKVYVKRIVCRLGYGGSGDVCNGTGPYCPKDVPISTCQWKGLKFIPVEPTC